MKNYFKKTTININKSPKIREALYNFTTKYLGKELKHLRKIRNDNILTDATLISFATGKVNAIQETKVFVVSKHNGKLATDSTTTYAIPLNKTTLFLKTMRFTPHMRNAKYKNTKHFSQDQIQKNKYSTKQTSTWTDWYNSSYDYVYPYFTSDYYYVGQIVVVAGVVVTCYYVAPAVASYMYGSPNNTPSNPPAPSNGASGKASSVAQTTADTATQAAQTTANAMTPQTEVPVPTPQQIHDILSDTAATDAFARMEINHLTQKILRFAEEKELWNQQTIQTTIARLEKNVRHYEVQLRSMNSENLLGPKAKQVVAEKLVKLKDIIHIIQEDGKTDLTVLIEQLIGLLSGQT